MPEFFIHSRPALAGKEPYSTPAISLKALPEGHVIHVLAKTGTDIASVLGNLSNAAYALRAAAPGQWFIVGDAQLAHSDLQMLLRSLAPTALGVDQSHGRIRILASGPMTERVLAKRTGVDLTLPAFPVGHATTTLFGHISAHLSRLSELEFEFLVLRGFAEALWDDLVTISHEFM